MATNPYDFTNSTQVNKGIIGSNMAVPTVAPTTTQVSQTDTSAYNPNTVDVKGVQQASTYTPSTATATDWSVGKDQTVAGQLEGILSSNSPLLQRAQTKALQGMNSRGLLNSSMAIGAGEAALYDAALPIAQADANTFATAGKYKADVANNMSQFNTTAQNNAAQYNAGATQQASKDNAVAKNALQSQLLQTTAQMDMANTDAKNKGSILDSQQSMQAQLANQETATKIGMQTYDAAVKSAMQDADAQNKLQLQNLDAQTRQKLIETEAKYKNQMQANQSVAQAYASMIDSFTKIMQDKDLDAANKQSALNQIGAMYENNMSVLAAVGGLGLDLNFNYAGIGDGVTSGVAQTGTANSPNVTGSPTNGSSSTGGGSVTDVVSKPAPTTPPASGDSALPWKMSVINSPLPANATGRVQNQDGSITTSFANSRMGPQSAVKLTSFPNGGKSIDAPVENGTYGISRVTINADGSGSFEFMNKQTGRAAYVNPAPMQPGTYSFNNVSEIPSNAGIRFSNTYEPVSSFLTP